MQAHSLKTAIVFSCDENYIALAKGLVLSLRALGYPRQGFDLVLIDIGCSQKSLDWMEANEVVLISLKTDLIPKTILSVIEPYQRALVMRPWLPEILAGYDLYIWFDADTWLQSDDVIKVICGSQKIIPERLFIAPGISHYNASLYENMEKIVQMQDLWFSTCYQGNPSSIAFSKKLHYSCGVFGLSWSSPVWNLWKEEITETYPLVAERNRSLLHLAEQTALNYIIHRDNTLFVRIDPLFNFHCNSGGAMRLPNGEVTAFTVVPVRRIGVIHLANWSYYAKNYMEENLLFRSGDYLTSEERLSALRNAAR
jgi:hypothetical protein